MLTADIWRPIPGFGHYFVSWNGSVVSSMSGRRLKPSASPAGYLRVLLYPGNGRPRSSRTIHSLVLEAFAGPRPDGMECIRHLNGDKTDNRLVNLAYGTNRENIHDKFEHGTDHQTAKTHCPQGHEYTAENTYVAPNKSPVFSSRGCRECRRVQARDCHRRKAAARRNQLLAAGESFNPRLGKGRNEGMVPA